ANYYLGIIYIIQQQWAQAINSLQKAARIEPKNPDPYFHLGQAYQATGQHVEAIEVLKQTIALTPTLGHNDHQVTTAHQRPGQSLIKTGQTDAGEKELQLAAKLKAEG